MEESDENLSFELQLEEAIQASLSIHQVTASSALSLSFKEEEMASLSINLDEKMARLEQELLDHEQAEAESMAIHQAAAAAASALSLSFEEEEIVSLSLNMDEEMARLEQERLDHEQAEAESMAIQEDINRQIHDQIFAQEMSRIPEEEWSKTGDHFKSPYGQGNSTDAEAYSIYCKGLVKEVEMPAGSGLKQTLTGIGVAIYDARDELVFKIRKPLLSEAMSPEFAETKAVIEGLNAALGLGMKRVTILCDNPHIHSYITGKTTPERANIVTLVGQVFLLAKKFTFCQANLLQEIKKIDAFGFANEAIVSQLSEAGSFAKVRQTCLICLEDVLASKMFSIEGCQHSYCPSCIKQHAEVKLHEGNLPKCPDVGCATKLKMENCKKLFTPELFHTLSQRLREASIPAGEKVYCPDPKCSALMMKTELGDTVGAKNCIKCGGMFCIECKVSWHSEMSCNVYRKLNPFPCAEDAKLNSLASQKMWRQCVKCQNMVELADGCYHISCRCGYEFCYLCGAEWKNKRGTCKCPLWDERNLIKEPI